MKKMIQTMLTLALAVCFAMAGTACTMSFEADLANAETVRIVNENGFSFEVPADWRQQEVDEPQYQYSLISPAGDISLLVAMEPGGMEYNSLTETGDQLCDSLSAQLYQQSKMTKAEVDKGVYDRVISGADDSGAKLVTWVRVWEPFVSVRYYLIFNATAAAYRESGKLLAGVAESFTLTQSEEQIYQLLQADRDLAAEAAAGELLSPESAPADGNGDGAAEPPEIVAPEKEGQAL